MWCGGGGEWGSEGKEGGIILPAKWKYFIGVESYSDYDDIKIMEDYFFSLVIFKKEKENRDWKLRNEITLLGEEKARSLKLFFDNWHVLFTVWFQVMKKNLRGELTPYKDENMQQFSLRDNELIDAVASHFKVGSTEVSKA